MKKLKIYLDNCSLNRPFDDLLNDKVRIESEAVLTIIDKCEKKLINRALKSNVGISVSNPAIWLMGVLYNEW